MALDLTTVYPGQLDPGDPTGYPYGQARNITVPGDGTGFPFERRWVNDLLGFHQALLSAAAIVPSGTPDKVGASQYLSALGAVIEAHAFQALSVPGNASIGTDATDFLTVQATSFFNGPAQFDNAPAVFLAGLQVTGGAADFDAGVALGSSIADIISVLGSAQFANVAQFQNGLQVTGGNALLLGELEVYGQVTLHGLLVAGAGAIVGAAGIINTGPASLAGPVTLSGVGHIRRRIVDAPDTDFTYSVNAADEVHVPNTITAPHAYTLSTAGAADGSSFTAVTYETTHIVVFNGLTMVSGTPSVAFAATWTFKSGAWRLAHVSLG